MGLQSLLKFFILTVICLLSSLSQAKIENGRKPAKRTFAGTTVEHKFNDNQLFGVELTKNMVIRAEVWILPEHVNLIQTLPDEKSLKYSASSHPSYVVYDVTATLRDLLWLATQDFINFVDIKKFDAPEEEITLHVPPDCIELLSAALIKK